MWWVVWLSITVLALIIEFVTADLVSVWFVGGGIVSLILSFCGLDKVWYVEVIAFIVVSTVLLLLFRKLVMKKFNIGGDKTNAESVIGKEFKLLTPISFNVSGSIKVNDVIWTAVTKKDGDEIKEGSIVIVEEIKGNKYIVKEKK